MLNRRNVPLLLNENHKRILWHLRRHGPAARIHLARALELGNGLVTRLTRELQSLGMVEEEANSALKEGRGRPTIPLRISPDGGYAVGATCQPGWIQVSLVDFTGAVILHDSAPFDDPSPKAFARRLQDMLTDIAGRLGMNSRRFLGIGIAAPGYVVGGDQHWVVEWLAGWRDVPLKAFFSESLGLPVWVENDASAAAVAEFYQKDVISQHRSALVFFLGHGVGGGVIADCDLFQGQHGNAGEVGRLFPQLDARPSGIDLLITMRKAGVAIDSLGDLPNFVGACAPLIDSWTDRVATQLRDAILAGTAWLDPGVAIISGALPIPILEQLAQKIAKLTDDKTFRGPQPSIRASHLGGTSVTIGAAMIPIHSLIKQADK